MSQRFNLRCLIVLMLSVMLSAPAVGAAEEGKDQKPLTQSPGGWGKGEKRGWEEGTQPPGFRKKEALKEKIEKVKKKVKKKGRKKKGPKKGKKEKKQLKKVKERLKAKLEAGKEAVGDTAQPAVQ